MSRVYVCCFCCLQEAQNQTVSAFDAHMEDCMARDWAANKRQLYGLLAPTFGNSMSGAPRAGEGNMPLIGSTPPRGGAAAGELCFVHTHTRAHIRADIYAFATNVCSACALRLRSL